MIKAQLNLDGWKRKFDRIGVAVKQAPDVELHAGTMQGELEKAVSVGDSITWSKAAIPAANRLMVQGVARIANTGGTSLTATMNAIGKLLVEDVQRQISAGKVHSSRHTNSAEHHKRYKWHHDTVAAVGRALTHRLVRR